MMTTRASCVSARAICTRCFWAIESDLSGVVGSRSASSSRNSARARSFIVFQSIDAAAAGPFGDEDILGDGQIVEHRRFLVDRGDAELRCVLRRAQAHGLAGDENCAGIRRVDSRENLDEGRLSGAILADQRRHLAAAQLERPVDERMHPREGLGYPGELKDGLRHLRLGKIA